MKRLVRRIRARCFSISFHVVLWLVWYEGLDQMFSRHVHQCFFNTEIGLVDPGL